MMETTKIKGTGKNKILICCPRPKDKATKEYILGVHAMLERIGYTGYCVKNFSDADICEGAVLLVCIQNGLDARMKRILKYALLKEMKIWFTMRDVRGIHTLIMESEERQ